MTTDHEDGRFMRAALALARRGLGRVWPNPAVGCLIVGRSDDGPARVLGRGSTGEGGRPHAETVALAQAGASARGATAYVTLEPCAHHGRTPPCTDALVAAGIARIVSTLDDPDSRVGGRGHAALRAAGIVVETGCLAEEGARLNAGHIMRHRHGRPHVTLKLAVSRDGMIAAALAKRTTITGEAAEARVHMMRALADAVMVGSGTWKADDPELTCRLPGLCDRSPVRIVLDSRAGLPVKSKLARGAGAVPLWVVVGPEAGAKPVARLEKAGAVMVEVPVGRGGLFDLAAVLAALGGRGITRLLVEGGGRLSRSLIAADLADEVAIFSAPAELGPGGVPGLDRASLDLLDDATRFDLVSRDRVGADTVAVFRRKR